MLDKRRGLDGEGLKASCSYRISVVALALLSESTGNVIHMVKLRARQPQVEVGYQ